nr:hypothetical protein [Escherichia coli]
MPSATQTARLEARISTELHAMLKRAAEIQVKKGAHHPDKTQYRHTDDD